ncbi:MAG TPA: peptidoglycan DD-metalloendopeptidase family protein [Solirubrobacteraceae bacterium]|nr:peptidoglycan DD-metalloendopeptidase family protein [Solirubrobacteraceae bacterium]
MPLLVCALVLGTSAPAAAQSGTGGAAAPTTGGSLAYNQPIERRSPPRGPIGPVATRFTVGPSVLEAGTTATFTIRIDGRADRVRAAVELTRRGRRAPAVRLPLGRIRTGRRIVHRWTPREAELPPAVYEVALQARDRHGRALHRTARLSGRGRLEVEVPPPPPPPPAPGADTVAGVFPIAGPWSIGGAGSRFGAGRPGHVHQGQDLMAAEGTPLVAPVPSTVYWIAFQQGGAGKYVVLRGADGRDYVFMHLVRDSVSVVEGAAVPAGGQFGMVGSTGSSSGPHLHFEIWPDGWYSSEDSQPIDPLPQLQAWAAAG